MFSSITKTGILFIALAFVNSGCTHYAPFPELEETEGTLVSDTAQENGKIQNKITSEQKKSEKQESKASPKKETASNKKEIKQNTEKKEVKESKDLTIPDARVDDVEGVDENYIVLRQSTHAVLTDIDLKEMDAEDYQVKVIKPTSETKSIVPVKKIQTIKKQPSGKKIKQNASKETSVFYLAETIYFNNGSSSVDSKYWGKLRSIVKEAKAHNGKIIVQGFASSRTRNTDIVSHKLANLKVSTKRADNVAALLIKYGMPQSRIVTEGLSDSRPIYQEVMPEGERLNRRAEIYIAY